MSMMVSFVLSFFPRDVLDGILNLIESVSGGFPSYSSYPKYELLWFHQSSLEKERCELESGALLNERRIAHTGINLDINYIH